MRGKKMITKIYGVKQINTKDETFDIGLPVLFKDDKEAMLAFKTLANHETPNMLNTYANEMEIVYLGKYNTTTGIFKNEEQKKMWDVKDLVIKKGKK